MVEAARTRRLKWQSRRGMKELDLLLERFIECHHEALAAGQWPEMEALLSIEDDRLWHWLQEPSSRGAERFRSLLEGIRRELQNRH